LAIAEIFFGDKILSWITPKDLKIKKSEYNKNGGDSK